MKLLFFCIAIFFSLSITAQTNLPIYGIIKDLDTGKKLSGVKISIYSNGSLVKETTTASNGKYQLIVPIDQKYDVKYTKSGYVMKFMKMDVTGINEEDIPAGDVPMPPIDIDIFTNRPSVDFSFTKTDPVVTWKYDEKVFGMNYDKKVASSMKKRINNLLEEAEVKGKEDEAKYNQLISEADKAFSNKDLQDAQTKYTAALKLKPTEPHPSNRLVEIDDLLAAQKKEELIAQQSDQAYQNLITAGDNFKSSKEYDKAIAKYKEAAAKKPDEQLPKDKLKEVETLKTAAANKEKYDLAITAADNFMKQNSLQAARDKYNQALKLDPTQSYPKEQLDKIENGLKAQEELLAKKKKYEDAISAGDKLFAEKKYEDAKAKFNEALEYESAATYPRSKIEEIDLELGKLAEANKIQADYDKLVAEADALFNSDKFEEAIPKYTAAKAVKGDETYPDTQIALANTKIEEAKNLAETNKIQAEYDKLVADADALFNSDKFEEAIPKYTAAKAVKGDETYPDTQIALANTKIEEAKNLAETNKIQAEYDKLVADADALFALEKYDDAIEKYTTAKTVKGDEAYPDKQITLSNQKKIELADAEKQAEIEENFKKLKSEADELFASQRFSESKEKYIEAKSVMANAEVDAQISLIDKKLTELENEKNKAQEIEALFTAASSKEASEDYQGAIVDYQKILAIDAINADAKNKMDDAQNKLKSLQSEAENEAQFNALKTEANQLFTAGNLPEAKIKYESAKNIKSDSEVEAKIKEIEALLEQQAAEQQEKDVIANLLKKGNSELASKSYDNALTTFNEVLSKDEANTEAKEKIALINTAKANLAEESANAAAFEKLKLEGNQLFAQKKYEEAKVKLTEALGLKEDQATKDKLLEIEAELSNQQNEEEKLENYNVAMSAASELENAKELSAAIEKYKEALVYKENDATATNKIKDLQVELSNLTKRKETEEGYLSAMETGGKALTSGNFVDAINSYEKALIFKPGDTSAKSKLKEAKDAIANNSAQEEIDAKYAKLMTDAAAKRSADEFDIAISLYKQAKEIKAGETAPQLAIDEINDEIERREKANNENSTQETLDKDYQAKIDAADVAVQTKNYERAIALLEEAKTLKPSETFPQQKIDEIIEIIEVQNVDKAKQDLVDAALSKANKAFDNKEYANSIELYKRVLEVQPNDFATEQIKKAQAALDAKENQSAQAKYNSIINKANTAFGQERYTDAIEEYTKALELKPEDSFVRGRIDEAKQILDNLKNSEAEELAKKALFETIIKSADALFDAGNDYAKAKAKYEEALKLYPSDSYANKRVEESILKSQRAGTEAENRQYQKIIDKADQYFGDENWDKATKLYKRAISFKSYDQYPKDQLEAIKRLKEGPIVEKVELEDLGEQQDISLIEGAALLQQAERTRNQLKKQAVTDQLDIKKQKTAELNYNDDEERQEMTERSVEAQKQVALEGVEGEVRRANLVNEIDEKSVEISELQREDNTFERGEILRQQQNIDITKQEIAEARAGEDQEYKENANKVMELDLTMTEWQGKELKVDAERTDAAYQDLIEESKMIFTSEDQTEEYAQIQEIQRSAQLAELERYETSQEKLAIQEVIDNDVKLLRGEAQRKTAQESANNQQANLIMDETLSKSREVISEFYSDADDNRQEMVSVVERKDDEIDLARRNAQAKEDQEIIRNELSIERTKEIIAEKKKDDTEELQDLQEDVVKASANVSRVNQLKSDEENNSRENTLQTIENTESRRAQISAEQAKQAVENNEEVKDETASIGRGQQAKNEANKNKALETQRIIDGFENNTSKYDETVANSLGEKYPEGVSQEQYVRKDENGLPVTIVTRRIVVVNGRGEEYIRTQTKFGVTYSKNGKAVTKTSWNNGTQNGKMVKHY